MARKSAASSTRPPAHNIHQAFQGHIFVSHSSKDIHHVQSIKRWLQLLDLKCWVSADDISDVEMRRVIEESLDACAVFLLVWSSNSLKSREVQIEINHAHVQNKPIISLQLDNTEAPKGVNMILRSYQYVSAGGSEKERYFKLGTLILTSYGLAKHEAIALVKAGWKKRLEAERLKEQNKKRDIEALQDKYWELHWDSSRDRARRLTIHDTDCLSELAKQLDIESTQFKRIKSRYKRSKQVFARSLRRALVADVLSEKSLFELESLRARCCISKAETRFLVARAALKPNLSFKDQNLPETLAWWIECLREVAMQSLEVSVPVATTKAAMDIQASSEALENNPFEVSCGEIGCVPIGSEKLPANNRILGDDSECKHDQPTCRIPRDAFCGFQDYLATDNPSIIAIARFLGRPGTDNKVISMAKESLKQNKAPNAYLLVGCASYLLGHMMDALTNIQSALSIERRFGDGRQLGLYYNMLGAVRYSLSDFNGAHHEFVSAFERDSGQLAYIFNRGLVRLFLKDANARADLEAFFGNSHARIAYPYLFDGGLADAVLSKGQDLSLDAIDELKKLPPLLPSVTLNESKAAGVVEQCTEEATSQSTIGSSESAMIDRDVISNSLDTSFPDAMSLIWDWRIDARQLDTSSSFEVLACQRRAEELLQQMSQALLASQQAIGGFCSTYRLGFLRCAPKINHSSRTLKAIRKLSLDGKQTGKPLLHFGESCFQLRHGFLLFERGIAICSALTQSYWYQFNPTGRNACIKFSLEQGSGSLLITIGLSDNNGQSRHSARFRFSNYLVKSNQSLVKALGATCGLLESREVAWMGIRQVIRKEMSFLRLFRQGIISSSVDEGLEYEDAVRVQRILGYRKLSCLQEDLLFVVCASAGCRSLLVATRSGLSCLLSGTITHYEWKEVLSFAFIGARSGCHFRINGSKNVQWDRPASEFGVTIDGMAYALSELASFISTLKDRLSGH